MFTDPGMNAVGPDQVISAHARAVRENDFDMLLRLRNPNAALGKMHGMRLEAMDCVREDAVQVGAVEHEVGRAIAFRRGRAELEPIPGFARAPVPNLPPLRQYRDRV